MLPTSNTESMPVAKSDREADEIAPYTTQNLARKEGQRLQEGLTLQHREGDIGDETRAHCDFYLIIFRKGDRKHERQVLTGRRERFSSTLASSVCSSMGFKRAVMSCARMPVNHGNGSKGREHRHHSVFDDNWRDACLVCDC